MHRANSLSTTTDGFAGAFSPQSLASIPAHGIFVTLVPDADPTGGQWVNASIEGGTVNDISAQLQPTTAGQNNALYVTVPSGTGADATALRTYSVLFSGMNSLTVTASGSGNDIINEIHAPTFSNLAQPATRPQIT